MNTWSGTSGFSYSAWKGRFYPDDLPDREMLSYYASRLNSVEINSTFYRMPTRERLSDWSSRVPERFTLALKASRRITHQKRLRDCADEVTYLSETASTLGPRLGPLLFQLPPYLKQDLPLLRDFAGGLPGGIRVALEFRHPSWFDDSTYGILREREIALVTADTDDRKLEPVVERTAPFSYARLRRVNYSDEDLRRWARTLSAPAPDDVYVYFKHEDEATGPRLAERFAMLMDAV